jgi:NADPH-dependent 2,4-dienoyl-CoA reductase/sulfur reductase-like enzyme
MELWEVLRMQHYKYLIIGGGMTADAAVHGIREVDSQGRIGLVSAEPDPPYNRPPLTKALWKGDPLESIWRDTASQGVELLPGRRVTSIQAESKEVTDDRGEHHGYERLLLATGGMPRRLPFSTDEVIYFRTLSDYRRLRALADKRERFAVIGGGFIGSELAAALAMNQKQVVMIFPSKGICHSLFPSDLSAFLNEFYRQKGVQIMTDDKVTSVERRGEQVVVRTEGQYEVVVDGVVAGLGIVPNVDLAKNAGVQIDNGIVVDELLCTNKPDIYAAGDVASFYNPALGKRMRVEHEDNANTMGRLAGLNMAGRSERYHHLPFFYSDLFDLGYEAVGELDSRLETVADWKEPYREGVIYYRQQGRVRGVLLWNVWEQVDAARELIAEKRSYRTGELMQKLPKAA